MEEIVVTLTKENADLILGYLGTKPYQETYKLIEIMQKSVVLPSPKIREVVNGSEAR